MAQDKQGMSGRDLQESQSGGGSGRFGGNMEQDQRAGQAGGGPGPSDTSNAGGDASPGGSGSDGQSRGERFDEEQGGGRSPESVSPDDDEIAEDQRAHQDRGQSDVEFEREQS
jgi:hypothetical protein